MAKTPACPYCCSTTLAECVCSGPPVSREVRMLVDMLEDVRRALSRCVRALDALHADDEIVRALARSGLAEETSAAVNHAVGVLDATAS